jgi:hypothetical protein
MSGIEDLERRVSELENADTESPMRRRIKAAGAVATFLIAVTGLVFGAISLLSAQRIKVSVTPRVTERQRPGTYQLGIVNSSARAVNIVSGEVLVDDDVVADVEQILPLVTDISDTRTDAELEELARELPYSVGAGESVAGTLIFTPRSGVGEDNDPQLNERIELLYGEVNDEPVDPGERVQLRLKFEPGGEKTEIVRFPGTEIGRQGRFPAPDHLPGWTTWIDLHAGRRTTFTAGGRPDAPALATLRLWKGSGGGTPVLARTHPLIRGWTEFPIPRLKRGAYVWSLTSASEVVAAGHFAIPCKGAEDKRIINPDTDC